MVNLITDFCRSVLVIICAGQPVSDGMRDILQAVVGAAVAGAEDYPVTSAKKATRQPCAVCGVTGDEEMAGGQPPMISTVASYRLARLRA
jgi:hypothetical protein